MEQKRILWNRKIWVLYSMILFVVLVHFGMQQNNTVRYLYEDSLAVMKAENQQQQKEYFEEYDEKITAIINNDASGVSVFDENSGYSAENRKKTAQAYKAVQQVTKQYGVDQFLEGIVGDRLSRILLFVFLLIAMLQFLEDRKRGLWSVIYSSRNGRMRLGARRLVALFFLVVICNAVMLSGMVAVAGIYYRIGSGEWTRSVQSISSFSDCILPLNETAFLIYYFVMTTLAMYLCCLVVWVLLQGFRRVNMGLLLLLMLFGGEYMLYRNIEVQSNLAFFKYINVWTFLFPQNILIHYSNMNLMEHSVNRFWLVAVCFGVLLVVLGALSLFLSEYLKPVHSAGWLEQLEKRVANRFLQIWYRVQYRLPPTGLELYKLWFTHKMGLVFVLVGFLMVELNSFQTGIYTPAQQFKKDYYERFQGALTKDAYTYLTDMEQRLQNQKQRYEQARERYDRGEISIDELQAENQLLENQLTYETAVEQLKEEYEQLSKRQQQGEVVRIVNQITYGRIFGDSGSYAVQMAAVLLVFSILVSLFEFYSYDSQYGMRLVIKAAANGRGKFVWRKCRVVFVATFLFGILVTGIWFVSVQMQYGFSQLSAPVQSVEVLRTVPMQLTIGQYLAVLFVCRMVAALTLALLVCLCSEWFGGLRGVFAFAAVFGTEELLAGGLGKGGLLSLYQGMCGNSLPHLQSGLAFALSLAVWIGMAVLESRLLTLHWNQK